MFEIEQRVGDFRGRGYDFAQDCGVLVPLRVTYSDAGELAETLKGHGLERSVIKLRTGNSSAKGAFYARSPGEAAETVRRLVREFELPDDRLPQFQEYVSGEGWGCWVFYRHDRRVASFTHRRVREKIATGGTSKLMDPVANVAIEQAAQRILDAIGWHVLTMHEFKVCPETEKFCFGGGTRGCGDRFRWLSAPRWSLSIWSGCVTQKSKWRHSAFKPEVPEALPAIEKT